MLEIPMKVQPLLMDVSQAYELIWIFVQHFLDWAIRILVRRFEGFNFWAFSWAIGCSGISYIFRAHSF